MGKVALANRPNAPTVPLSFCHVHGMRHERHGGCSMEPADADAVGTNTKLDRRGGGIFMTKRSKMVRVLKPTRTHFRIVSTPIFPSKSRIGPLQLPSAVRTPGSYQFVLLVKARPAHFLTALMNGEGDFESVLPRPLLAAGAKLDFMLRAFLRDGP